MEALFYIVCNALQLLVLYAYSDKMLERKYSKGITFSIWICIFLLDEIVIYFNNIELINFIAIFLLLIFAYFFAYRGSVKRKILTYIFIEVFTISSEMLTMVLLVFANINPTENFMMGSAISKILYCVLIRIALIIVHNRKIVDMSFRLWLCVLTMPVGLSAVAIILDLNTELAENKAINIVILILLMIINYVAFFMFDDIQQIMVLKSENKLLEQQRSYYLNQCEQVNKLWDNMREFRHNIKNRYVHERILLKAKNYGELEKQYDETIGYINSEKLFASSGNVHIDSIINYKLTIIKQLGAKIKCELKIPIVFSCNYDDIIIVLGNLMDNAIEALEEVEEGEREFSVKMIYAMPNLLIKVSNTYSGDRKIDKNGNFITNKHDKELHGIGLKSVKRMVELVGGKMNIETKNGRFEVNVHMIIK